MSFTLVLNGGAAAFGAEMMPRLDDSKLALLKVNYLYLAKQNNDCKSLVNGMMVH